MWGCYNPATIARLGLEAAHERGVVGELGADHLHRHLPAHRGLEGR